MQQQQLLNKSIFSAKGRSQKNRVFKLMMISTESILHKKFQIRSDILDPTDHPNSSKKRL